MILKKRQRRYVLTRRGFRLTDETYERLRLAAGVLALERGEVVCMDWMLWTIANAGIAASLARVKRAGGNTADLMRRAYEGLERRNKGRRRPTTHGPAPTAGSVYEH